MAGGRGAAKDRVSSGRIRGRGFLWGPEGSYISQLHFLHPAPPKNANLPQLPPSPSYPQNDTKASVTEGEEQTPEASAPTVMRSKLALVAPSLAAPEALEVAIPTHMTPLHLQLGGIKRVYKCQVKGCMEGP